MIPVFRFAPWQPPVPATELSQPTSQVAFTPAVLLSTSIVVALLLFVWAGPWVWQYDPAQQWLSHISQGPTPAMSALVSAPSKRWCR